MHEYQELSIDHYEEYYEFTRNFSCYSDLNFVSLICWSSKVLFKLSKSDLTVIFEDYESNNSLISGLCLNNADRLINEMIILEEDNPSLLIDALPAYTYEKIKDRDLAHDFKLSLDQSDYLYSPDLQLKLEGSVFSWYRRKLSIFNRLMSDHPVQVTVSANARELDLNAYNLIWQDWSTQVNHKEASAMYRYITLFPHLKNQSILTITIDSEIKAFAFLETINCKEKTVLIHFFKSSKEYEGLANYLFQEIARYAKNTGVKWINFEQDLGEDGLRQYKQKLCPTKQLEKYTYTKNIS